MGLEVVVVSALEPVKAPACWNGLGELPIRGLLAVPMRGLEERSMAGVGSSAGEGMGACGEGDRRWATVPSYAGTVIARWGCGRGTRVDDGGTLLFDMPFRMPSPVTVLDSTCRIGA